MNEAAEKRTRKTPKLAPRMRTLLISLANASIDMCSNPQRSIWFGLVAGCMPGQYSSNGPSTIVFTVQLTEKDHVPIELDVYVGNPHHQ